jgi:hypothetical protein
MEIKFEDIISKHKGKKGYVIGCDIKAINETCKYFESLS